MATAQIQVLLRFLSRDAKVPLAMAMGKVMELQKADMTTAERISQSELKTLQEIFKDDKVAKQVLNAAKRVSKKRSAPAEDTENLPKKILKSATEKDATPFATECALALPISSATEEELADIVILTNRAPLVLAFALCALKYTMPEQPISSRLSLAQAVVSANSRSKAISLGIESGEPAEKEGWGEGQPRISVLGREIKVLKRWDYNPREGQPVLGGATITAASDDTLGKYLPSNQDHAPPLWGIDTEALKRAHPPKTGGETNKPLPIFTPNSARSYLLKSFTKASNEDSNTAKWSRDKSQSHAEKEEETCLGHLLHSIDLVCRSWAPTLSKDELDKRAWAWYIRTRPDVQSGVEGWGQKGLVKVSEILALKRQL